MPNQFFKAKLFSLGYFPNGLRKIKHASFLPVSHLNTFDIGTVEWRLLCCEWGGRYTFSNSVRKKKENCAKMPTRTPGRVLRRYVESERRHNTKHISGEATWRHLGGNQFFSSFEDLLRFSDGRERKFSVQRESLNFMKTSPSTTRTRLRPFDNLFERRTFHQRIKTWTFSTTRIIFVCGDICAVKRVC